jgi:hypothetical protein
LESPCEFGIEPPDSISYGVRKFIILFHKLMMMIGMLLVSRSELEEEEAVEVFRYYGFQLSFQM